MHFQALEEKNGKQDEGKSHHDIDRDYKQLCVPLPWKNREKWATHGVWDS